jgi:hypothetical protein
MLAKAPNRKAAVAYLAASGAVPITIKSAGGLACTITTGTKITGTIAGRWWIAALDAARIASAARQGAGPDPATAPWRDQRPR